MSVHIVIVPRQITNARYRNRVVFDLTAWVCQTRIHVRRGRLVEHIIIWSQVTFPTQAVAHVCHSVLEVCNTRIRYIKRQYLYQTIPTRKDRVRTRTNRRQCRQARTLMGKRNRIHCIIQITIAIEVNKRIQKRILCRIASRKYRIF